MTKKPLMAHSHLILRDTFRSRWSTEATHSPTSRSQTGVQIQNWLTNFSPFHGWVKNGTKDLSVLHPQQKNKLLPKEFHTETFHKLPDEKFINKTDTACSDKSRKHDAKKRRHCECTLPWEPTGRPSQPKCSPEGKHETWVKAKACLLQNANSCTMIVGIIQIVCAHVNA